MARPWPGVHHGKAMHVRELIREIHRRSIWQVVSVYLVGGWIAFQVVETLTSGLGLPSWFPSLALVLLIAGFPIVLATAIVQEGPPGVEPESAARRTGLGDRAAAAEGASPENGNSPRWLTWRNAMAGGVLAFALWGAVAAGWLLFGPAAAGERAEGESARSDAVTLAVLPLDNLTGDDARQYLVDGVHEALIHELTRIPELTVKSRTSVMRFREQATSIPDVSERLGGVDRVIEGSVFGVPRSDSLRVTVQLIAAPEDEHLWSREYWGTLGQLTDLQARVARGIAAHMAVEFASREDAAAGEDPVAPEAVELYMQARAAWREASAESMERSVALYRRALQIEPAYALAWAGLADSYLVLAHVRLPAHRAFPDAKAAAERALQIDDRLARAHAALGDVRFHYEWDWSGSEEAFRRALELNPGYVTARWWYSGLLAALGRMDESVDQITRARELDPLSPQSHGFAVRILYYGRRFGQALDIVERMQRLGVSEFMTVPWAALSHQALGDSARALELLEAVPEERRSPYVRTARVQVLSDLGQDEAARRELAALEEAYDDGRLHLPHLIAVGYASLDERQSALDWLETSAEDRDGALPWLTVEPTFDALRSSPRFLALLDRMGLPSVELARR